MSSNSFLFFLAGNIFLTEFLALLLTDQLDQISNHLI